MTALKEKYIDHLVTNIGFTYLFCVNDIFMVWSVN